MKIAKIILFTAVGLLANPAVSAVRVTGPLTELWVSDSNGAQFAWLRTSAPFTSDCGQSAGYMFIELSQPNGKEAYAMALAAFLSGREVTIGGAGTCNTIHEKVKFLYMTQ